MINLFLAILLFNFSLFATTDLSLFDPAKLQMMEDYLFKNSNDEVKTKSLLIMKNGKVIYEKYTPPYTAITKHISWSMGKTVSALIIGIAVQEKILKLTDTVGSIVPGLPPIKSSITINDLLHMSSGIKFSEVYEGAVWKSDVHSMLFKNGAKDMGDFVLQLPMGYKPGERFYYSSGDTNVLMYLLKKKMSKEQYDKYPFEKLFHPLEILNATFEQDASGTFIGSSLVYLSSEDYAKIASLFLNKGKYKGKQIIDPTWLEYMKEQTPGFSHADNIDSMHGYGAQLWLNYTLINGIKIAVYPSLPEDSIFFKGIKGQLAAILPEEKIIIIRTALDDSLAPHKDYYFYLIMNALKNKKFTPAAYNAEPNVERHSKREITPPVIEEGHETTTGINNSFFSIFKLSTNLATRLICSCHFVQGNDLEFCLKTYGKYTFIWKSKIENNPKAITLQTVVGSGHAVYRSAELGCYLD